MRTTFTDEDDKELVQLAVQYVRRKQHIDWNEAARLMRRTRHTKKELCGRLSTLKQLYGCDLLSFPTRYFTKLARKAKRSDRAQKRRVEQCLRPLEETEVYGLLHDTYADVAKREVTHAGKRHDHNAGELAAVSVTDLIRQLGEITKTDVFLDVGYGLRNVVAQFAMQTQVKMAVGIEIRGDLLRTGKKLIQKKVQAHPQLQRTFFILGDICTTDIKAPLVASASILFSNNLVFAAATDLALERVICGLKNLRCSTRIATLPATQGIMQERILRTMAPGKSHFGDCTLDK